MNSKKHYVAAAAAAVATVSIIACTNGRAPIYASLANPAQSHDLSQTETQKTCDVLRSRERKAAIKAFGIDKMSDELKKISQEVSADDIQDLNRLSASASSFSISPDVQKEAKRIIAEIYENAIDRAGFKRGEGQTLPEIKRTLFTGPAAFYVDAEGFVSVLSTDSQADLNTRSVGDLGEIYLASAPDQNRYKVVIVRYIKIETEGNGQKKYTGNYLSLSDYAETRLPAFCKGVPTGLNKTEFDTLSGINAK